MKTLTHEEWVKEGCKFRDLVGIYNAQGSVNEEYSMEGISDGYVVFRKMDSPIDNLVKAGYLIAGKDGINNISTAPVVHRKNATEEEIQKDFKWAEERLRVHYAKL